MESNGMGEPKPVGLEVMGSLLPEPALSVNLLKLVGGIKREEINSILTAVSALEGRVIKWF